MTSTEREAKRIDRNKRKERKQKEAGLLKQEEAQQQRKRQRIKIKTLNLTTVGGPDKSGFNADDDMLQFMDSVRDSVVSYFNQNHRDNFEDFAPLDTPTRILNNSNEFLPITYTEDLH